MEKENKIIFWGNDLFSIIILEKLIKEHLDISALITGPDTPQGRKLKLVPPLIIDWAQERKIKYWQIKDLKSFDWKLLGPSNKLLFIVASFGKIIPQDVLSLANLGVLNIHPSLLPQYRGASPIQTAILNQDKVSGVTLMLMDNEMDHGPILAQKKISIIKKNYGDLLKEMGEIGGQLISENLEKYLVGELKPLEQNHQLASYCKKIDTSDGLLDLNSDYRQIVSKIRALSLKPGIYFNIQDIRIKLKEVEIKDTEIIIKKVTPAGRKEMSGQNFLDFLRNKNISFRCASFVKFL